MASSAEEHVVIPKAVYNRLTEKINQLESMIDRSDSKKNTIDSDSEDHSVIKNDQNELDTSKTTVSYDNNQNHQQQQHHQQTQKEKYDQKSDNDSQNSSDIENTQNTPPGYISLDLVEKPKPKNNRAKISTRKVTKNIKKPITNNNKKKIHSYLSKVKKNWSKI